MTPSEQTFALLQASSAVTNIVGTKVYPTRADDKAVAPYLVFFDVFNAPQNSLSGWSGLDNIRLQIDVWHTGYFDLLTLKDAVRSAMSASNATFKALCINDSDGPVDSGLKLYHRVLEFSLWAG